MEKGKKKKQPYGPPVITRIPIKTEESLLQNCKSVALGCKEHGGGSVTLGS